MGEVCLGRGYAFHHALCQPAHRGRAFDENYIGNFSLFHITHDEGRNLFLQEALSEVLSFGISAAARYVGHSIRARWFGILDDAMDSSGRWSRILGKGLAGEVYEAITSDSPWHRKALRVVWGLTKEYVELVGEVVFEMSFDNMLRLDPAERPLGGGQTFLTLMTLYSLTRAGLDGRFEPGPLQSREMSAARRAVNLFSSGLLVGQMIGMTPVLLANRPQMGLGAVGVAYGYGTVAMAASILSSSRSDIRTAFTVLYDGAAGTVLLPVYYIGDIRFTGVPIVLGG